MNIILFFNIIYFAFRSNFSVDVISLKFVKMIKAILENENFLLGAFQHILLYVPSENDFRISLLFGNS